MIITIEIQMKQTWIASRGGVLARSSRAREHQKEEEEKKEPTKLRNPLQ